MSNPPTFEVVPKREANRRRKPRRERRDWKPVINALVAGEAVFMSDDQLTESDVKYLMLSLSRRGKGERLRTERIERNNIEGRLLEVVTDVKRDVPPHLILKTDGPPTEAQVNEALRVQAERTSKPIEGGLSPAQLDRL